MKDYEGIFILEPVKVEEKLKENVKTIEETIKQFKGRIEKFEEWGMRKLQYPIRGHKEAHFYLIHFSISPDLVADLRKDYQLKEGILRFSIFKKEIVKKKGEKNG